MAPTEVERDRSGAQSLHLTSKEASLILDKEVINLGTSLIFFVSRVLCVIIYDSFSLYCKFQFFAMISTIIFIKY